MLIVVNRVVSISNDAIVDENRGLIFPMQVRLERNTIDSNGKKITLKPGMSVSAELSTGKRKLIEFFLAPLLRYSQEGLRER